MYPAAKDVARSRDETYYVADFIQNGFDTKVWFNSEAQWEMRQIDWETMDEVPNAVYNAFCCKRIFRWNGAGSHLSSVSQTGSGGFCNCGNGEYTDRYQLLFTLDGGLEDERNATYFNNLLGAEVFL